MKRRYSMCKKGLHRLTPENTYHHPSKGEECRECKRDYMRDYMRERRAAAASRRKKAASKGSKRTARAAR